MIPRLVCLLLVASLTLSALLSCAGPQQASPQSEVLTPQEIIDLSQRGVPPAKIARRIEASEAVYVLTVADVGRLQAEGVADEVIDSMLTSWVRAVRPLEVRRSLWYRQGQFYAAPPFSAYQGAYRFDN